VAGSNRPPMGHQEGLGEGEAHLVARMAPLREAALGMTAAGVGMTTAGTGAATTTIADTTTDETLAETTEGGMTGVAQDHDRTTVTTGGTVTIPESAHPTGTGRIVIVVVAHAALAGSIGAGAGHPAGSGASTRPAEAGARAGV